MSQGKEQATKDCCHDLAAKICVDKNPSGIPCVNIEMPGSGVALTDTMVCSVCDGTSHLTSTTEAFPFRNLGVIVRFVNARTYICDDCGIAVATTDDALQMEDVLFDVTHRIEASGLSAPKLSVRQVEKALGLVGHH
jgi:predicted RNA-binding Zn-ribbon protein involved in translation (DUF1610 family)